MNNIKFFNFMNEAVYILIIIILGGMVLWMWFRKRSPGVAKPASAESSSGQKQTIIEKQEEKQQENIKKIIEFLETRDKVANNDIEKLLSVSNATAERYLAELEKEGILKQVGKIGKNVYYTKI